MEQCSGGLQDEGAAHLEQQPSCSSNHRDSVSTLDAFESAGAASLDGPHDGGAVKQHAMRSGTAVGGAAQPDCGLGAAGAPDHMNPAHSCAGAQATSDTPQPSAARSLQHHLGHLQETAAAPQNGLAQAAPHDSGLPMGRSGQQQQPMQRRAGSPAAVPHGYAAATMYSEPCPASSGGGGRTPCIPRKVLCASVDDLYQELFGDVPLPSASSSAAHSPFEGSLHNLRGVSSMSPMTTSSAFCHQHAAAAAIAGSGGMPGVGSFIHEVGAGPTPRSGASNSSSYSGVQSPLGGVVAGGRYGECAGMLPVVQPPHPMGDMLPLGATNCLMSTICWMHALALMQKETNMQSGVALCPGSHEVRTVLGHLCKGCPDRLSFASMQLLTCKSGHLVLFTPLCEGCLDLGSWWSRAHISQSLPC